MSSFSAHTVGKDERLPHHLPEHLGTRHLLDLERVLVCPASCPALELMGIHLGESSRSILSPSVKTCSYDLCPPHSTWLCSGFFSFSQFYLYVRAFPKAMRYPRMQFLMTYPLRSPPSYIPEFWKL